MVTAWAIAEDTQVGIGAVTTLDMVATVEGMQQSVLGTDVSGVKRFGLIVAAGEAAGAAVRYALVGLHFAAYLADTRGRSPASVPAPSKQHVSPPQCIRGQALLLHFGLIFRLDVSLVSIVCALAIGAHSDTPRLFSSYRYKVISGVRVDRNQLRK
jgi:hypothetical protein